MDMATDPMDMATDTHTTDILDMEEEVGDCLKYR